MKNQYYTKQEDGSFHPVTLTTETLAEILADTVRFSVQAAVADKVAAIIDSMDLASEAQKAIDSVDMDDIASEAVRDEIERRVENLDISVDVSI